MDVKGLGWKHVNSSFITLSSDILTILEENYPELLHSCYIINAPSIFGTFFNFFKPILSKNTQEKIYVSYLICKMCIF